VSSIRANGFNLEYVWHGPAPDKTPTIVFLHEGLGCVAMWRDFPERVAEATGCGALVFSRAGYGNSDPITLPRPVTFMHDEALQVLPEVLEALHIREAILFGHSDGGSIALIYAGSRKANKVRALILEAPHVFVEDLSIRSIIEAKHNYENSLRTSLERYHGSNVDCAFRGWNDVWLNADFLSWNIESFLPEIRVPVLVIQGEKDQYGTLNQVEAIKSGCRGPVRAIVLPESAHSPHRDQPQLVLDAVTRFLGEVG
jgi:pimeloyl-ACP methyl ester carboxylesterase